MTRLELSEQPGTILSDIKLSISLFSQKHLRRIGRKISNPATKATRFNHWHPCMQAWLVFVTALVQDLDVVDGDVARVTVSHDPLEHDL